MFVNIVLLVIMLVKRVPLTNKKHSVPIALVTVTMGYAPIVASMKISLITVIPWRQQLSVNMNCSRTVARPLANEKTKFTQMLNVLCTRLSGKGMHHLTDTCQRRNCRHVGYKFDSSFSLGSLQKSLSYINLQKQHSL